MIWLVQPIFSQCNFNRQQHYMALNRWLSGVDEKYRIYWRCTECTHSFCQHTRTSQHLCSCSHLYTSTRTYTDMNLNLYDVPVFIFMEECDYMTYKNKYNIDVRHQHSIYWYNILEMAFTSIK